MKRSNPKQYFNSVEDLYTKQLDHFTALARRHVYNKDLALDVVHDAFAKALIYFNKHPSKKVRPQIMEWLVLKACKKVNKNSVEIPMGDTRYYGQVDG